LVEFGETQEETGVIRRNFFLFGWSWYEFSIWILKILRKMNQTKHYKEENEAKKLWSCLEFEKNNEE